MNKSPMTNSSPRLRSSFRELADLLHLSSLTLHPSSFILQSFCRARLLQHANRAARSSEKPPTPLPSLRGSAHRSNEAPQLDSSADRVSPTHPKLHQGPPAPPLVAVNHGGFFHWDLAALLHRAWRNVAARVINQNVAHHVGGYGEKVARDSAIRSFADPPGASTLH